MFNATNTVVAASSPSTWEKVVQSLFTFHQSFHGAFVGQGGNQQINRPVNGIVVLENFTNNLESSLFTCPFGVKISLS